MFGSKSFYYSTDDALQRKAFTDILNCCDIHLTYILIHMVNLLNRFAKIHLILFELLAGIRRQVSLCVSLGLLGVFHHETSVEKTFSTTTSKTFLRKPKKLRFADF